MSKTEPCPVCATAVRVGAHRCARCGATLFPDPQPGARLQPVCPVCAADVGAGDERCPECGLALVPQPLAPPATAVEGALGLRGFLAVVGALAGYLLGAWLASGVAAAVWVLLGAGAGYLAGQTVEHGPEGGGGPR